MSDAFQCDRCNEFQPGSGKEFRVGEYVGTSGFQSQYDFEANRELCSTCYSQVIETVLVELENSPEVTE